VVAYEPWIEHLVGPGDQPLAAGAAIEDSAYIGFGKGGLYFEQPGRYRIRAIYHALDGSQVFSNVLGLRVRYPVTAQDERLAELLIGEEQGAQFYLMGSDSPSLRKGADALDQVLKEYGRNPIADYIRFIKGVNLARTFKTIKPGRAGLGVRAADTEAAAQLITAAVSEASPLDPISKGQALNKLALAQEKVEDKEGAAKSRDMAAALMPERKPPVAA
jgi:hypothetical protein